MSKDSSSKKGPIHVSIYRFVPAIFITLGSVILFVSGQFVGILLFTIILSLFGMTPDQITNSLDVNSLTKLGVKLSVVITSIGLVIGLLKYINVNPFEFLKINKKLSREQLKTTLITYGLYFLSFIVVSTVGKILISGLDVDQQQQLGYGTVTGIDLAIVFATLVILPALTEEIFFRGFLFRSLKETSNLKTAAIITSLLFAAAHLEFLGNNPLNWIAAIDTFVLSLFLIWLYQKTNNLWSPIILHALKNSVAFFVLFVI